MNTAGSNFNPIQEKDWEKRSEKYLSSFTANMDEGITYYQKLFAEIGNSFSDIKETIANDLKDSLVNLKKIGEEIDKLSQKYKQ